MSAAIGLAKQTSTKAACEALSVPRSSYYREQTRRRCPPVKRPRPAPPLALSPEERTRVLDILHSERFVDQAPRTVWAALLDEEEYYCSPRTMYRLLAAHDELRERRRQKRHPAYKKPELLATGPNQLWSWDITKLKGPAKWSYFYLYVVLDVFSRYVVGWLLADRESASLATKLLSTAFENQNCPTELTVHADRGTSMGSKPVAFLLADLGVTKSHSRPYTRNDNPFSEAQFKTLKYCPKFPERFGCIEDARVFCREFFRWYNSVHYHEGIGLLTPEMVHYGSAEGVVKNRQLVLHRAFLEHPNRFKHMVPNARAAPGCLDQSAPGADAVRTGRRHMTTQIMGRPTCGCPRSAADQTPTTCARISVGPVPPFYWSSWPEYLDGAEPVLGPEVVGSATPGAVAAQLFSPNGRSDGAGDQPAGGAPYKRTLIPERKCLKVIDTLRFAR